MGLLYVELNDSCHFPRFKNEIDGLGLEDALYLYDYRLSVLEMKNNQDARPHTDPIRKT